jgi:hypothetical protein
MELMEFTIRVLIFSFLVILELIMDKSYETIDTTSGKILNILHHIFAIFLFFPFIIKAPRIHILVMTLTIISWVLLKGCVFTMVTDKFNISIQKVKFQNFRYHLRKWFFEKTNSEKQILFEVSAMIILGFAYNIYLIMNETQ